MVRRVPAIERRSLETGKLRDRKRVEEALQESEERLRTVISNSPIILFALDREGVITLAEGKALSTLGLKRGEIVGRSVFDVYRDVPEVVETVRRALAGEAFSSAVQADGLAFECSVSPLRDRNGEVAGVIGVATDITERARAEAALREGEERYRDLVENINEIIYSVDSNGIITYVSPVVERLGGYTPSEVIGRSFTEFIHPDDLGPLMESFQRTVSGNFEPFEYRVLTKSGEAHWVRTSSRPVFEGDRLVGLRAVLMDITDRKRAEEALRESEERYRSLIETSPDAITLTDLDGNIIMANRQAVALHGCESAEDMIGRSALDFVALEDRTRAAENITKTAETGSVRNVGHTLLRKDGTPFPAELSASLIVDAEGKPSAFIGVVRDVTERKRMEEALRDSEERYRRLVEVSPDAIVVHCEGRLVYANPAAADLYGASNPEELMGKPVLEFIHPDYRETVLNRLRQLLDEGKPTELTEIRLLRVDGQVLHTEIAGVPITYLGKPAALSIVRDITERKRAEEALQESEKRYRLLAENASDVIWTMDLSLRYTYVSPSIMRMRGYSPEELVGETVQETLTPDSLELARKTLAKELAGERAGRDDPFRSRTLELEMYHKDGSTVWTEVKMTFLRNPEGQPVGILGVTRDITERKKAEETIRYLAYHDTLTGLPNATLFKDRLDVALAQARRSRQMVAVMWLDLNRFKLVNDTVGHAGGDQLLRGVGEHLTKILREVDTVARVGGDKFALLVPGITQVDAAVDVAERVLEAVKEPRVIAGHEFHITTSVGIALYPTHGRDAETLLRNADTAMYRAREQGSDAYLLFMPSMNANITERAALETQLRHAFERNEFHVHYQPQVDVSAKRIVGMEALARWKHSERGLVYPDEFIPLAEDTGLIVPLGEWVLRTACIQNKAWQEAGLPSLRLAVNLSARQFQPALTDLIRRVLKDTGLDPQFLELEITEGIAMRDLEFTVSMLRSLRDMGVTISIDDFGTGYSSLGYLKRFPIDAVKVDRTFVRDMTVDPDDAAIVSAIIGLAQSLNLRSIAEGVEKEEQLAFLQERGCHQMQGYLFSPAVPAEEFERILKDGSAALRLI